MTEQPEITTVSEKGQVVIPQPLREEMKIKPRTKFLVFGGGDTLIMKRLEMPDLQREWKEIFKMMDKKGLRFTEKQVVSEIGKSRKEKHSRKRR